MTVFTPYEVRYLCARKRLRALLPQPSINGDYLFGTSCISRTSGRDGVCLCWSAVLGPPDLDTTDAVEIRVPGRFFGNGWPSWETYGTVADALAEPRLSERLLAEMQDAIREAETWAERSARTLEADRQAKAARFERALAPRRGWIWGPYDHTRT